jgi:hypothetical protein
VTDVPIPLTPRLLRHVERDFPAADDRTAAIVALERVDLGWWAATQPPLGRERVLAAILAIARRDLTRLSMAIEIAERDWRDALVWGGYGSGDWSARLDALLGDDG